MQKFDTIYQRALKRKGQDELTAGLSFPKSSKALRQLKDEDALREMTKCVFRSGFVWKIIEAKWPGFEEAFFGFDVTRCAMLSDEELEQLATNTAIVRHAKKIASVRNNARFILEVRDQHKNFGTYLATWPADDFVELWSDLKKRGDRLGGQTGRFFLRFIGRDTPMFSRSVVNALILAKIVEKEPTSKGALKLTQAAFNTWRNESGRSYTEISRVLAMSVPD